MATGNGAFFSYGITFGASIVDGQIVAVYPTKAADVPRFMLFVDGGGNPITPELLTTSNGIDIGEGRVGGLKYVLPSTGQIIALETRVSTLETKVGTPTTTATADTLAKRNADGELVAANFRGNIRAPSVLASLSIKTGSDSPWISLSETSGPTTKTIAFDATHMGFFGQTAATRPALDASSGTLANDVATALATLGLVTQTGSPTVRTRWDDVKEYVFTSGPASTSLAFGQLKRINASSPGVGEVLTVTLPLVTAVDVGKPCGLMESTGAPIGPGNAEIQIDTTSGQDIDINRVLPLALTGTRPKIVLIACLISSGPDVYGWAVESLTAE